MRAGKHFYIIYLFQLENNCFTILCWFVPYINMNQPQVYICPRPLEPPTLSHPSTLSQSTRFESYSKFLLVILHGNVCVSMIFSQFAASSSSRTVSTSLLTVPVYPILPSKQVHERLLLNNKTPGFLASGGDKFNPGPEMRLDRSEIWGNRVLLKYKGDRESF